MISQKIITSALHNESVTKYMEREHDKDPHLYGYLRKM